MLQASLLAGGMLAVMANASLSPALPQLRNAFADASDLQIRMILTFPALVIVVASPLAGWTADHFGRKPLLILSALLFGVAGSSGYLAQDIVTLLAGRALLGVAAAGLMTSLTTLVVDYFSGAKRARFMGLQAAVSGLGGSFFLILGGVLAEAGWRQPFLLYLVALALLPFMIHFLYEPGVHRSGVPLPRVREGMLRALRERGRKAFAAVAQVDGPLLRLVIFCYVLVWLNQAVFNLVPLQLPFLLLRRFGTTTTQNGVAISLVALSFSLSALLYGRIATRVAHIPLAGLGLALLGGSCVIVGLAASLEAIYAGMVLSGLGLGLLMPNLNLMLANRAPQAMRGRLLGGYSAFLYLGQFLSPLLLSATGTGLATGVEWLNIGFGTLALGLVLVLVHRPLARLF